MNRLLMLLGTAAGASLPKEADWIIVGGGASGCTAAAALADAGQTVVVVERGGSDLDVPSSQTGLRWAEVVASKAVENIRWTEGAWGAVAQVLGGGASVNDGYFFEESPDHLANLMKFNDKDLADYYASSKYLADRLLTPLPNTSYGFAWAEAINQAGYTNYTPEKDIPGQHNIRYKDGTWTVASLFNSSNVNWTRNTPAVLLHQRASNPNLTVVLNTHVMKVVFDGVRASGVQVKPNGLFARTETITAKKGVLMAAGAIYTPQVLQLSGVGDVDALKQLNITPVISAPGVGKNFVDRLTWAVAFASLQTEPHFLGYTVTANSSMGVTFECVGGADVNRYMAIPSLGLVPAKERSAALRPVMEGLMSDAVAGKYLNHLMSAVGLMHETDSRGTILVNADKDATKPPNVTANYFSAPSDEERFVATLKALVNIVGQPALNDFRTNKAFDPPAANVWNSSHADVLRAHGVSIDEKTKLPSFLHCLFKEPAESANFVALPCPPADASTWGEWLKANVLSTYHYFGTAAVGDVLEPGTFKVKGSEGLYVIDAAAIPTAPRINPVGTVMSVGHMIGTRLGQQ